MIGHYSLPIQDVLNQRSLAVQVQERDIRNLIVKHLWSVVWRGVACVVSGWIGMSVLE